MTRRRALPLALVPPVALLLAGCHLGASTGAGTPTSTVTTPSAPTATASPTPAAVTSSAQGSITDHAKQFRLLVPTGWKNITRKHTTSAMFLQSQTRSGSFYPTFMVVAQQPQPMPKLGDVVSQARATLQQSGATVTKAPDTTIGGEPAQGYLIHRTADGRKIVQTQYFVVHDGTLFTTTMSADATKRAQAAQTQQAILDTWSWVKP